MQNQGKSKRALTRELMQAADACGVPLTSAQARVIVARAVAVPRSPDGWARWLRNEHGIADPTGEAVAWGQRDLDRGGAA